MKHIILTSGLSEKPIDAEHRFVCIGPNCWGGSESSAKEALKNCQANAARGAKPFITRWFTNRFKWTRWMGAWLGTARMTRQPANSARPAKAFVSRSGNHFNHKEST